MVNEKNKKLTYSNVLSASQELGMIERSDINKDIKFEQDSICGYKIVRNGDYVVRFRLSILKMEVWNDKGRDCCRVWLSETVIPDADTIAYDRKAVGADLCTRKKPAVRMTGSFSCAFLLFSFGSVFCRMLCSVSRIIHEKYVKKRPKTSVITVDFSGRKW